MFSPGFASDSSARVSILTRNGIFRSVMMVRVMDGRRRAATAKNDARILDAARRLFLANPSAPIADVAMLAGVGISALYHRYASKEELLRELARDGLTRYIADLRVALEDEGDPWQVFSQCLHRVVDGESQALAQRVAGTFRPTESLRKLA